MKKRILAAIMCVAVMFAMVVPAFASAVPVTTMAMDDSTIVILHTNDTHCAIEDGMGFEGVAAYRDEMEAMYEYVTLVDAGDAVQGGPVGKLTTGMAIVDIMNAAEYDIFVLGNHEFDYQIPRMFELMEAMDAEIVSSNFIDLETGESVFNAYAIVSYGDVDVAYVGITTPESFTKSTPTYFQDENGEFIYGFSEDESGEALYANVQASVDAALEDGADYVIALGHLGVDEQSAPWRSTDVIENTTGIDVFIDGHSHTTITEEIANEDGETVLLNQTGAYFSSLGKIMIDTEENSITAELITEYEPENAEVKAVVDEIIAEHEVLLNEVVAQTDVVLAVTDPATGERMIRNSETNLGNLAADGYRYLLEADVALVNGGGIRADIEVGEVTNNDIISVHPFGNNATLVAVTGQMLLDALEMGSKNAPEESGGFLHVSGMTYAIDTTIPSSVVTDDKGSFVSVDGEYRVFDVTVGGEPLDLDEVYTVASHDYMLLSFGDGMTMFDGAEVLREYVMVDNEVLINYITENLGGVVGEEYSDVYGEGRITMLVSEEVVEPEIEEPTVEDEVEVELFIYEVVEGDTLVQLAREFYGDAAFYELIYEVNSDEISNPDLIYVGQILLIPSIS